MLNRKILDDLAQWAARKERKPLKLRGARQDREIFERSLPFPELVQVMFLARNESLLELMMARFGAGNGKRSGAVPDDSVLRASPPAAAVMDDVGKYSAAHLVAQ